MLVIRVVSFQGRPVERELAAKFGEAGGNIGRDKSSTLVLPDAQRYISRTHASITFQAGGYIITDQSPNALALNGREMGPGTQARLSNGDQIKVGDYILEAVLAPQTAPPSSVPGSGAARPLPSTQNDPFAPATHNDPFAPVPRPRSETPDPFPASPPPQGERLPTDFLDLREGDFRINDIIDSPHPQKPVAGRQTSESPVLDPLDELLRGIRTPGPSISVEDHVPEINTPFIAPRPVLDPPPPKPDPEPPIVQPVPPPQVANPPAANAGIGLGAADAALLAAFLRGAGVSSTQLGKGLTPEMMETMGAVLREAVQGTLDLLRGRALTKNEFRIDATQIMPQGNNPLKFSPTAEAALNHLLAPHGQGYLPPLSAMKQAFEDLKAHQLGILAGMRAALDEVLDRFSPERLEKHLTDRGLLGGVLPKNKKARLWELFIERYGEVVGAAQEDFSDTSNNKAFRRAYEDQVQRLRGEQRRDR